MKFKDTIFLCLLGLMLVGFGWGLIPVYDDTYE